MKSFFKWAGIGIAILIVIGVFAGASKDKPVSSNDASSVTAPMPDEIVKITAQQLFTAYDENEVAADERFKGKVLEVSGTVQAINKDAFDNIVINLRTSNEFMSVHLKIVDDEKAAAIALKKWTKVAAQCRKMSRIIGSPMGGDCRFVKSAV